MSHVDYERDNDKTSYWKKRSGSKDIVYLLMSYNQLTYVVIYLHTCASSMCRKSSTFNIIRFEETFDRSKINFGNL